jgi:hypothetical protein
MEAGRNPHFQVVKTIQVDPYTTGGQFSKSLIVNF